LKSQSLNIVLIGSGNVATQLGISLKNASHKIIQVFSIHKKNANTLAKLLKCDSTDNLSAISKGADIYIISIKDDTIISFTKKLKLNNKIVVHTSGSIEMEVLKFSSKNIGVFYPLQTISKNKKIDFTNIPICIEANNSSTLAILKSLAKSISNNVNSITSKQRKQIHLAAVFACNFSNHLYAIANTILKRNNLPLSLLYPLIDETATKIKHSSPAENQTGPAKRRDKKVMQEHIKLLGSNIEL